MNVRSLAFLLGLTAAAATARAQVGIYVAPTAAKISIANADTGPFAFLGDGQTSRWFKGADLGIYYDFAHSGSLKIGVDVRDRIIGSTTGARANSFLVGLRAVYAKPARLHPYAEAVVGVTSSHSGTNPYSLRRAEYGALVGADYTLNRHLDWRVVEIGFGSFTPVSSQTFGTVSNPPNASIITAASGFVIRF